MDHDHPQTLAAELRARAFSATAAERTELLFLAAEYERLGDALSCDIAQRPINVCLPK